MRQCGSEGLRFFSEMSCTWETGRIEFLNRINQCQLVAAESGNHMGR